MLTRRHFLAGSAAASGAALLTRGTPVARSQARAEAAGPAEAVAGSGKVETPDGASLPYRVVDGVKVYHLVAEPIEHEFMQGLDAECWGYNGRTPGPTIEAVQGDRVRLYVENKLPEPTTVHWHGLRIPNGMDGVGGLTQRYIRPGQIFKYEFTCPDAGTFMYHPHVDEMTQIGLGLHGMFLVHPRRERAPVDRDFALMLHEWHVPVGASRPDPREMVDFNVLTMNSKCFPGASPLVVRTGQRVRIRFGNLSAMHNHPIHLHGYAFRVTATDGGATPASARLPETTVLVPVGSTRVVEFVADAPGDWAMHCHFTHHIMNQMGHGGPNLVGMQGEDLGKRVREAVPGTMLMGRSGMSGMGHMKMKLPGNSVPMRGTPGKHDYIDMGGMFTVLKVRDGITSYEDPGWYEAPEGTLASEANPAELKRDGIA